MAWIKDGFGAAALLVFMGGSFSLAEVLQAILS